jgi:hypothetical protein
MSEELKKYTVVTNTGYWGKGHTPAEAARNAHIRNRYVEGYLCYADPLIVDGEIEVTDMGGVKWFMNDAALNACGEQEFLGDIFQKRLVIFKGKMKVTTGKLDVKGEITADGWHL